MTPKGGKSAYDDLLNPRMGPEDDFALEDILAEYGGSREQNLLRDVEKELHPLEAARPRQETPIPATPEPEKAQPGAGPDVPVFPKSPKPVTLEEVVGSTVDAVMEEERQEALLRKPKRGLFSRKRMAETEQLYERPVRKEARSEEEEPEVIGPEPDLYEAAERFRIAGKQAGSTLVAAALIALVPAAVMAVEFYGVVIPYWSTDLRIQSMGLLGCLLIQMLLCGPVFAKAIRTLRHKRCTGEVLVSLAALLAAGDCVVRITAPGRSDAMPCAGVCCAALAFALWGIRRENRAKFDTLRTAAMDTEPPYLVTETSRGACKQRGEARGFYTAFKDADITTRWQAALMPVVLVASLIFGGLSSLGLGRGGDFLLNWSMILTAGATFGLPLCWGLPYSRLAAHLQKAGCAVAGWRGVETISRKRGMILTDTDLFPLSTIQLNGVKVFGEELQKADSYAASMARAAGSGLARLFDTRIRSEGGHYREVVDFSFYEEGGWSGMIRGESILMGTASFMRKMDVRLPGNINLKTGVFLAVDRELIAVYAVKYQPAENVDYALRMLQRGHIVPTLASRDPNITPALLKRKFHKSVKVEFPDLVTRVALSEAEQDRGMPRALLLREGLLPYAEVVAGSHRLALAVRRATWIALLGSLTGTLLTFYLTFLGAYSLLTPLMLEIFLLLWTLPVLLMADWTGRY